jgi:hypothetical protein
MCDVLFSRYHFAIPGTKVLYTDSDCSHCFSAIKRWDSIALHEFCELHPDFLSRFNCVITGGAGGLNETPTSAGGSVGVASVSKASKASIKRAELTDITQRRFIDELVNAIKPVANPQVLLRDELLQVSSTLRELAASNDSEDEDLIEYYKKRKAELRYELYIRIL